tara:strand:- start:1082 stop:1768 length:687 start_codon:yes stop_codon:yes gene_type:complete
MKISNPISTHGQLGGVTSDQHHAEAHALGDHSAFAHSDLSDAPATAHHTKYTDAEAVAAIEAEAELEIQGQINFPDSQSASADANTLDDYEEGTFTPSLADSSLDGSGEGQSYSTQAGYYTKIGNVVLFYISLTITSLGTLTVGQGARIMGLPFTIQNVSNMVSAINVGVATSLAKPNASETMTGALAANTAYITLNNWDIVEGTSAFLVSEFSAGGQVNISGHYRTA